MLARTPWRELPPEKPDPFEWFMWPFAVFMGIVALLFFIRGPAVAPYSPISAPKPAFAAILPAGPRLFGPNDRKGKRFPYK